MKKSIIVVVFSKTHNPDVEYMKTAKSYDFVSSDVISQHNVFYSEKYQKYLHVKDVYALPNEYQNKSSVYFEPKTQNYHATQVANSFRLADIYKTGKKDPKSIEIVKHEPNEL